MELRDIAWAKLNLTLEILGRRADGFHELRSLVAFAGVGDTVAFAPKTEPKLKIVPPGADASPRRAFALDAAGPFATALGEGNLILDAAEAARARVPSLAEGRFRLVKTLPVAAGLGGGSADAAAALRLLVRASGGAFSMRDAEAIAPDLGSDIAVCLHSAPALMMGRGEVVAPVAGFPQCGVVLANPHVELATSAVYGALNASPFEGVREAAPQPDFGGSFEALIAYASMRNNDLERVAIDLAPEIDAVLERLRGLDGERLVRLSGSGATCFAVFEKPREALRAAILLAEQEPNWWVIAGTLGDPSAG